MTDLELLAVQYRSAEREWERAFLRVHSRKQDEGTARKCLVRTRLALDAEIERRISESGLAAVDEALQRAFASDYGQVGGRSADGVRVKGSEPAGQAASTVQRHRP